ncbi:glycosyltransferase [Acinetobacter sichuanensis]|uniref:glycosyltransferase n=1 Tax=Acinetobacter sichuanensis TaxID=2136183 RepID=UPI00280F5B65|nr:glycosyltransferase [Acinetobacter sichuanensis]MDQ9022753.1 glycosyltransferase [Acinetobacter sichuanensis]
MINNHLFVFPTAVLGGAERVMFNIIYHLLLEKQNVTVIIMSRGKQVGWEKIEYFPNLNLVIHNYPSEKKAIIPLVLSLIKLSRCANFDYIFSSHTHINGLLSFLKKMGLFKHARLVSRESTFIFDRFFGLARLFFKFIYHFMYGKQDLIICQTEKMKSSLIAALGFVPGKKIEVVPNPVNIDYIKSSISNIEKQDIIVACGRLIPLKKFDLLLQAFSELTEQHSQYKLVLIGDGPERVSLEKLTKDLNLLDRVIFTGKISNPIQWFANAKIGVISSEIEGFPNVLIEMMAAGIECAISTPCTDGVYQLPNILVTKNCSVGEMKTQIEHALDNQLNFSQSYQEYIEKNRSAEFFWNNVLNLSRN